MNTTLTGVAGKPIRDMDFWTDAEQMEQERLRLIARLGDPDARITRNDIGAARRMLEHCRVVPEINWIFPPEGSS
jgi:hypothetical protein